MASVIADESDPFLLIRRGRSVARGGVARCRSSALELLFMVRWPFFGTALTTATSALLMSLTVTKLFIYGFRFSVEVGTFVGSPGLFPRFSSLAGSGIF